MSKIMEVDLIHTSRQFAKAVWLERERLWKVRFRGGEILMTDLSRVSARGFEFAGSGGAGGWGGERLSTPSNINQTD